MNTRQCFADNLRRLRVALELTQEQLAERVGCNPQAISNYENGTRWPQPDVVDLLAKALKARPWQLFVTDGEVGDVPPLVVGLVSQLARACGLKVNAR